MAVEVKAQCGVQCRVQCSCAAFELGFVFVALEHPLTSRVQWKLKPAASKDDDDDVRQSSTHDGDDGGGNEGNGNDRCVDDDAKPLRRCKLPYPVYQKAGRSVLGEAVSSNEPIYYQCTAPRSGHVWSGLKKSVVLLSGHWHHKPILQQRGKSIIDRSHSFSYKKNHHLSTNPILGRKRWLKQVKSKPE